MAALLMPNRRERDWSLSHRRLGQSRSGDVLAYACLRRLANRLEG